MVLKMKYFTNECLAGLLMCILMLSASFMTIGCTTAQITNVETIITTDLPTIISGVTSILSLISALSATSGTSNSTTSLSAIIAEIQAKGSNVETILANYKAGTSTWADVIAAVDALYVSSSATIDLSGIKNSSSQAQAKIWLAAIDLAVNTIYTAVLTTQNTSTVKTKLAAHKDTLRMQVSQWTPEQKQEFVSQLKPVTGLTTFAQYQAAM